MPPVRIVSYLFQFGVVMFKVLNSLKVTVAFLCLFLLFDQSLARILNVPEDWESIQVAVNATEDGDTVLVAPGMYVGGISLQNKPILLASWILLANNPAYVDSTILDGNMGGTVLRIENDDDDTTFVRGFTVQRGRLDYGGGVNIRPHSKARLEDLVIQNCIATRHGGGLYVSSEDAMATVNRVKFIGNEAVIGGAIGLFTSSIFLDSCEISENTAASGAVIESNGFITISIANTIICDNILTGEQANKAFIYDSNSSGDSLFLDHVTFANNVLVNEENYYTLQVDVREVYKIVNSIFWDPEGRAVYLHDAGFLNEDATFSFNTIRQGRQGAILSEGGWGDGNINADPRFIAPASGDYRLSWNSPCIDAGDPDSTADADGSRCDMGAFAFINQFGWLEGRVSNRSTERPVANAVVRSFSGDDTAAVVTTDTTGNWLARIHLPDSSARLSVEVKTTLYHPFVLEGVELNLDDTIRLNIQQTRVGLLISPDSMVVALAPADTIRSRFFLANADEDTLVWRSRITAPPGILDEPGELQDSINVSQIADDDRIQGVLFVNDHYYLTGANGNDPSLIYVMSREGELISNFEQRGTTRFGARDMASDGALIWTIDSDTACGYDENGEIERMWSLGNISGQCIAFDPIERILWISGVTGDIYGFDTEGNWLGRVVEGGLLRKYGLAWYPEDEDGYALYILTRLMNDQGQAQNTIYKINPIDGDTIRVMQLGPIAPNGYEGLEISNQFSPMSGWSYLTVDNRSVGNGGDQVLIYCLDPFKSWFDITPRTGTLAPDDEIECQVTTRAVNSDGEPADSAHYRMEFRVSFEGDVEGEIVFPIDLYIGVQPPVFVPVQANILPRMTTITSSYPNPFNSYLRVNYYVGSSGKVKLLLNDLLGRQVETLFEGNLPAGEHQVIKRLDFLPTGVYYLRLENGDEWKSAKVILLK